MQPRKILAVDDSKLMLKMYEVMLRQYPLVSAADGREALLRLEDDPEIDVVLLDLNMPVMGGLEVLAALKGSERLSRLAVVIVTTDGKEDEVKRGIEAGASAYVTKPFQTDQLIKMIADLGKGPAS